MIKRPGDVYILSIKRNLLYKKINFHTTEKEYIKILQHMYLTL